MLPAPTRAHHRDFCVTEGWTQRTTVRGETGDHVRYDLALPDGRILSTRISHPVSGRATYGKRLWAKILRDDLEVTAGAFWACVQEGALPERGIPALPPPEAIPLGLFHQLVTVVGLAEADVRTMTKAEAAQRLADYYTFGPSEHKQTYVHKRADLDVKVDVSDIGAVLDLLDDEDGRG